MPKPRKTLGDWQDTHIQSLMRLIETQSKTTIANWCVDYAEKYILPIYNKTYPEDDRPKQALDAARRWLAGEIKLPEAKRIILNQCHQAAREAGEQPAAQAAARCCGQVASTIHAPAHSLGLAFYGAAAIAYDRVGIAENRDVYEQIAAEVSAEMEASLRAVAVENEPHPAKVKWNR
jgi:hypothetical protein